jgi:hypothetical protein
LLLIAPAAHASGVFLKWDACHADGGVSARSFACDTNSGFETLVGSVVLDTALVGVIGMEARIVGQSASSAVPDWWEFKNAGLCRTNALTLSSPADPVGGCPSLFGTSFSENIAAYKVGVPTSGSIQIDLVFAGFDPGIPVAAGQEYFLFGLQISHAKTVGPGACAGCLAPMCLGTGYLQLQTSSTSPTPSATFRMNFAPIDQGHLVSWQNSSPGGVYVFQVNPPFGHLLDFAMTCDAATPVRRSTWGAVRSLYR